MKVCIRYSNVESPKTVAAVVERHLEKIQKLLKRYAPDLVQLHGSFEKHPHRAEFTFSVDLSLPTGTLCASAPGPSPRTSARNALSELEVQIKKHQALLRGDFEWKRKRGRSERALA